MEISNTDPFSILEEQHKSAGTSCRNHLHNAAMATSSFTSSAKLANQNHSAFFIERNTDLTKHADQMATHHNNNGSAGQYTQDQSTNSRNAVVRPSLQRTLRHQQRHNHFQDTLRQPTRQLFPFRQTQVPKNAVTDILPFCTTEPPLSQEQVISLSDIVGSLKELALLALEAATGDTGCVAKIEAAVGAHTTANIVDFFVGEWEVE
jgi:hypothetical protein